LIEKRLRLEITTSMSESAAAEMRPIELIASPVASLTTARAAAPAIATRAARAFVRSGAEIMP